LKSAERICVLKTSVIVATRNNIGTIEECLSSLVPDYSNGYIGEIIVVDGHSTDGTLEVVKKYPVKLLADGGLGVYAGLDVAWRSARHDLVMFIDSDAFTEMEFFPAAHAAFEDEQLGILGCLAKASANTPMERTIGQWWEYHGDQLGHTNNTKASILKKLYYHATGFSNGKTYTSGPCYIARRKCLDEIDGFSRWLYLYQNSPGLLYPGDNLLSRDIAERGWKAEWWTDAPVRHHPPENVKQLLKQRCGWGKGDGALLRLSRGNGFNRVIPFITRLATPLLGIRLALRYHNWRQLVLLPLAQYAWIGGYIASLRLNLQKEEQSHVV
jgi:cellulose synthase/poly-beta-1,6-N-acetylglucosamine synthase-like glycosyltransferase